MRLYLIFLFLILSCGDGHHLDQQKAGFYLTAAAIQFESFRATAPQTFEIKLSSNAQTLGDSSIVSYEWEIINSAIITGEIPGPDGCGFLSGTYSGTAPRKQQGRTLLINDLGGSDDIYVKHTVFDNFGNSASAYFFFASALVSPICDALDPAGGFDGYINLPFTGSFVFDKTNRTLSFSHHTAIISAGPLAPPTGTIIPEILHDIENTGSPTSIIGTEFTRVINSTPGTYRGTIGWGDGSGASFLDIKGEYLLHIDP